MSALLDRIRDRARNRMARLVLAEGEDERVLLAAQVLSRERIAAVSIIGNADRVLATAVRIGVSLDGIQVLDASQGEQVGLASGTLERLRGERLNAAEREELARDPLFQAAARVRAGAADCLMAGAVRTTADVLRATLWLVGTAPGVGSVSSFFVMVVPSGGGRAERVLLFADCGVIPEPSAGQLGEIACLTADSYQRLTGEIPYTALLSFSTLGSADHPRVRKVREAVAVARARRPDRHFDGELQADAALDESVARKKAAASEVAGRANVLVFPDLDAGNIGYKLVQRLGGAAAYGPVLQGLARQASDLSRGCSAEDMVQVATIACAMSDRGNVAGLGPAPSSDRREVDPR